MGQFLRNGLFSVLQSTWLKIVGVGVSVVLARSLGPAGLGSFTLTNSIAQSIQGFSRLGADAGTHVLVARLTVGTHASEVEERLSAGLGFFLVMGVIVGIICMVFADPIAARIFAQSSLSPFVFWAGALAFFQFVQTGGYVAFAALHNFKTYALISGAAGTAAAVLTLLGAYLDGPIGAVIASVIGQAVTTIAVMVYAMEECRANGVRFHARLAWHPTVEAIKLGFPFFTAVLLLMPVELAAQTLLVRWHGVNSLGDIRTAAALTSMLAFLPSALNAPLVSMFAAADASSPRLALMRAVQSMKGLWLFAMAVTLGLLTIWRELVLILFGPAYRDALTYGSLSVVLTLFMIIIAPLYNLLLAQKRTGTLLVAAFVRAAIMLGAAALLLKPLGVAGLWLAQMLSAMGGLVAVSIAAFASSRDSDPASRSAVIWMWGGLIVVTALGVLEAFAHVSAPLGARLAVLLLSLPTLYIVSTRGVFSKGEVLLLIHRLNSLKAARPS